MTAALPVHPGYPYTADEVLGWADDGVHHEVIEGALYVSPHADMRHQLLLENLRDALRPALPAGWRAIGPSNLRLSADTLLVPDLLVLSRVDTNALAADPADVRLAVEVVSPGSSRIDRLVKPGLYAEAGIEHFWLIDGLENAHGPVLHEHQLMETPNRVYGMVASWWADSPDSPVEIIAPFEVSIVLSELTR